MRSSANTILARELHRQLFSRKLWANKKFLAGLLAFPTLVSPSHPPAGGQWYCRTKADPDKLGTGLQLRGQLRNRLFAPAFPFNLLMLVTAEEPQIRNKHKPLRCILQGEAHYSLQLPVLRSWLAHRDFTLIYGQSISQYEQTTSILRTWKPPLVP